MKTTPATPPRRSPFARVATALAGAIAVIVLAYVAGRWGAEAAFEKAARASSVATAPQEAGTSPASRYAPAVVALPAPAAQQQPAAHPPASVSAVAQQAKHAAEVSTRVNLERLRRDMLSRCWPSGGLAGGQQTARLSFSIVFDETGREIARGISEDRRAPGREFARCLRALPMGTFSIPAPGARATVNVPMTFP